MSSSKALLVMLLLTLPQFAGAGVFMCIDPATGKKIFTDKGCPDARPAQEVRVEAVNFGEGDKRAVRQGRRGTWASDRDVGSSGRELNSYSSEFETASREQADLTPRIP